MKPQLKSEVITSIDNHRLNHQNSGAGEQNTTPKNLDELTQLARKMLMEESLEVSKIKPLFWSMIEIYIDRFQAFPFDVAKALQSYLELNEYPADQMQNLVSQLEEMYALKYGRPMKQSTQLISEQESLDEEIRSLRDSLKYATMVGELEES